jgi:haloalkane dehalogenase
VVAGYTGCKKRSLTPEIRNAYKAPYDSWANRIAILRFVQDIPLTPRDQSYCLTEQTSNLLHHFRELPTLICWGAKDFVFDDSFLEEWQRRLPQAEVHRFPEGGHNIIEDTAPEIISLVTNFLAKHDLAPEAQ